MGKDFRDLTLDDIKADASSDTLLDPELTLQCMDATMSYYITLHKIVTRKLQHATKATRRRINELEAESQAAEGRSLDKAERYQCLSDDLLRLKNVLDSMQLTVEDLEEVDQVFTMLPGKVKLYFDYLVTLDVELIAMINEISSEEYRLAYQRALKIVELVQGGKNILSGRTTSDEYRGLESGKPLQALRQNMVNKAHAIKGCSVAEDGTLIRDL